ncbi:MAG: phospholipase D-like domain-containing protein [Vulcanimicrobiaceae bacterium]
MISLSSTSALSASLRAARSIVVSAYMLPPGALLSGLLAAARRGANVTVRLEGAPYRDSKGSLKALNDATAAKLRAAGADARAVDSIDGSGRRIHLKAVVIDGRSSYLDDRNFARGSLLVTDTSAADAHALVASALGDTLPRHRIALTKRAALGEEVDLIDSSHRTDTLRVGSEAIGDCEVTQSLEDAAARGVSVHLRVCRSLVASNVYDRREVARLQNVGIDVQLSSSHAKYAMLGNRAWIGSANATPGLAQQSDWGVDVRSKAVLAQLRHRLAADC